MPLLTGLTGRPPAYRAYRAYGAYRRYRALPKIFPPAARQTLYEVSGALWPMLLLALASIFSLADAQHFNFVEFAGNGQVSGNPQTTPPLGWGLCKGPPGILLAPSAPRGYLGW